LLSSGSEKVLRGIIFVVRIDGKEDCSKKKLVMVALTPYSYEFCCHYLPSRYQLLVRYYLLLALRIHAQHWTVPGADVLGYPIDGKDEHVNL